MSASIDFSEIREMTIAFSGLSHLDDEYTFSMMKPIILGSFG